MNNGIQETPPPENYDVYAQGYQDRLNDTMLSSSMPRPESHSFLREVEIKLTEVEQKLQKFDKLGQSRDNDGRLKRLGDGLLGLFKNTVLLPLKLTAGALGGLGALGLLFASGGTAIIGRQETAKYLLNQSAIVGSMSIYAITSAPVKVIGSLLSTGLDPILKAKSTETVSMAVKVVYNNAMEASKRDAQRAQEKGEGKLHHFSIGFVDKASKILAPISIMGRFRY